MKSQNKEQRPKFGHERYFFKRKSERADNNRSVSKEPTEPEYDPQEYVPGGNRRDEVCIQCGGELPPLNGIEENDFCTLCESCEFEKFSDEEDTP